MLVFTWFRWRKVFYVCTVSRDAQRFRSVVVITFALHAKGHGFEPRRNLTFLFLERELRRQKQLDLLAKADENNAIKAKVIAKDENEANEQFHRNQF